MGTVWRARDEVLGRQVAVKRLHVSPQLDADELATRHERTTREAQAAARINHPNVVSVHDVVDDEGSPCIVMEYVPSATLGDAIKEATGSGTYLTPRETARIGRGMIAALRAAHSAGVLHRDVKPGNVLLGEDGRVVLTDFGIAVATGTTTLTKTGELVGSIDYLAPERVKGSTPGPASDLWALGATLYQAVEGKPPFRKNTAVETAYSIAVDPLEAPRNAGQLTALIEALLAKEPGDRPTAEVVEQALRAAEAEADTALMGWPTLALGTVGRGRSTGAGSPRCPPGPWRTPAHRWPPRAAPGRRTHGHRRDHRERRRGHQPDGGARRRGDRGDRPGGRDRRRGPATATGDRPDVLPSGPAPRKRRGRIVAWVLTGLLVTGGGGGTAWYLTHRDDGTAAEASDGTSVAPVVPHTSVSPPPPTPHGYRRATEKDIGASFPVPSGWKRQVQDNGRQLFYISEDGLAQLTISCLDFASADQVQHFKSLESDVKSRYAIYTRLRLQDTIFQGDPAAIWEFSFQGRAREYRGIDLGFGREGGKEYAIYVSAPSANWSKYEQVFANVKDGFRRTSPAG
ncbi:serine/threonine-protein kinase [Streptomyces noursei]|nr:serine/threonine-protein kinase [Streptomyces noursei]